MTAQGETWIAFSSELREAVSNAARTGDRDRYWAALFVRKHSRTGLMSLAAFNAELARIPEVVSEPLLGEMRLQWWRDAMESEVDSGHMLADAMRLTTKAFGLDRRRLQGLIDARIFDITGDVMPDMQATGAYLQKTAGSMFALSAKITIGNRELPPDIISDAATAYGLTGLMRALAVHRRLGRLYLPLTLFEDHGATLDDVFTGSNPHAIDAALASGRAMAGKALENARRALQTMDPGHRLPFLPLALVEPSLKMLAISGHKGLETPQQLSPLTRLWRLTRAAAANQI